MTSVLAGAPVRRALLVTGAVLAALVALLVGAHAYAGDRLPRGTTAAGVSIGGLDRQQAVSRLTQRLGPQLRQPFAVVVAGTAHTIEPTAAGLRVDAAATVARAGAVRSWSPRRLLAGITGGSSLEPVVTADQKRLGVAVARLAADSDRPLREGSIDFSSGTAVAVQPQPGVSLDRGAARSGIVGAFLRPGEHILAVTTTAPLVTADAVQEAVRGFGAAAVSGDIGFSQAGRRVAVPASAVVPFVSMKPGADGALTPEIDTDALLASLGPQLADFGKPAVNATVPGVNAVLLPDGRRTGDRRSRSVGRGCGCAQ